MLRIGIGRKSNTNPLIEAKRIRILNLPSLGTSVKLVIVDAGFLDRLEPHGHKFSIRTYSYSTNGCTIISTSIIGL